MNTFKVKIKKTEYTVTIGLKDEEFVLDIKGKNFSYEGKIGVQSEYFYISNDWGQWMRYYTASGSRGCEAVSMFFYDKHTIAQFRSEIAISNKMRGTFTKTQFETITEIFYELMRIFMDYHKFSIREIRRSRLQKAFEAKREEAKVLFEVVCAFDSGDYSILTDKHASVCSHFSSYIKTELEKRNGKS